MSEPTPPDNFFAAFGLLSHLYLTPVLGALVRGHVPDHLDQGPLPASELARRSGLDELSLTRSLRALAAFGAFREVSAGVFANTPVSEFFRDRPGGLRNTVLFWGGEHLLKSAAELGHSVTTGEPSFEYVYGGGSHRRSLDAVSRAPRLARHQMPCHPQSLSGRHA